ncbi:hypothetical protein C0J52_28497, partial [Blattella germanica]
KILGLLLIISTVAVQGNLNVTNSKIQTGNQCEGGMDTEMRSQKAIEAANSYFGDNESDNDDNIEELVNYVLNTDNFMNKIENLTERMVCQVEIKDLKDFKLKIYDDIDQFQDNYHFLYKKYMQNLNKLTLMKAYTTLQDAYDKVEQFVKRCDQLLVNINSTKFPALDLNQTKQFEKLCQNGEEMNSTVNKYLTLLETEFNNYQLKDYVENVLEPLMMVFICMVGVPWNTVLLFIYARHKSLRTIPNMMFINLAVGDLLCILFSIIPITSTGYVDDIFYFFRNLFRNINVYSLAVISVQRYQALVKFSRKEIPTRFSKIWAIKIIILVWITSAIVAISRSVREANISNKFHVRNNFYEMSDHCKVITMIEFVCICLIPLFIIVCSTLSSTQLINKSIRSIPGESYFIHTLKKTRTLSSYILIALTIVFIVSYVPYHTFHLAHAWSFYYFSPREYFTLCLGTSFLRFFNPCFNPIALYSVSRAFRNYFNRYLFCLNLKNE